jgi:hypothetical protein
MRAVALGTAACGAPRAFCSGAGHPPPAALTEASLSTAALDAATAALAFDAALAAFVA